MPFQTEITPLLIITKLEQYDYAGAATLGAVMLTASLLILLIVSALERLTGRHEA
jgi:sulfate transport system permease protein